MPEPIIYTQHYIDGAFVAPLEEAEPLLVHESGTGEVMGQVPAGSAADADRAVLAARRAFDEGPWRDTTVQERAAKLDALAGLIKERTDDLAALMAREVGMPLQMAKSVQAGLPLAVMSGTAEVVRNHSFQERVGTSLVLQEPIGVVACITPWNYPLHQIVAKVAPALAAGCTVVVKPSEVAPLNAFSFAQMIDEVGFPPGVFNLVSGEGPIVGEAMVTHAEVDMVSFTGSTRAGRRVSALAAETIKRVTCELGGKSANIILDDLDEAQFARAVKDGVRACYLNSGQTCSAPTRMIVPRARREEVLAVAKKTAEAMTPGDPFDEGARLGPLVSSDQRERVRKYIRVGLDEGATLLTGGEEAPEGLPEAGYYVQPTVFVDVDSGMRIAQEEIFGPVLSILFYDDVEEAIRIANDSDYGLAGRVWASTDDKAIAVARKIRTGQLNINGGPFNPKAPFGGYRQSGNGREMGRHGLEEFLEVKSLQLPKS